MKMKNKMKATRWTWSFLHGALAAVVGSFRALTDPELRSIFLSKAKTLFIISVILVSILNALLLPFEWILSIFGLHGGIRAFRYTFRSMIPFYMVSSMRYYSSNFFEKAFFAGLKARDPILCKKVLEQSAHYWDWEYFSQLILSTVRRSVFGMFVNPTPVKNHPQELFIGSLFGALVPFIRFGYRIRRMEIIFWIPVFVMFCLPRTRLMSLYIVQAWMDAGALTHQLFDSITSRRKRRRKWKDRDSKKSGGHWYSGRNDAARLGFAMIFGLLLQIPFLGPFTWFLGFISAGLFAPELVDLEFFIEK